MANDPVQCCAFDTGCAGTDTALWQLFCPRELVFLFFKISILGSIQPKIVNRLESNDQKYGSENKFCHQSNLHYR